MRVNNLTGRFKQFFRRNLKPIVYKDIVEIGKDVPREPNKLSPLIVDDCLKHVFTFLNAQDLMKVQLVNKQWHKFANSNQHWEPLVKQKFASYGPFDESQAMRDPYYYKRKYFNLAQLKTYGYWKEFRHQRDNAFRQGLYTAFGWYIFYWPFAKALSKTERIHQVTISNLKWPLLGLTIGATIATFADTMVKNNLTNRKRYKTIFDVSNLVAGACSGIITYYLFFKTFVGVTRPLYNWCVNKK